MSLTKLKREYQDAILEGMARSLWVWAYMNWRDEAATCEHCDAAIHKDAEDRWADDVEENDPDAEPDTAHLCAYNDNDDGSSGPHEPSSDGRARAGADWDEVAPETPDGAYLAARDLAKLIAKSEGIADKNALADLFELAMNVEHGEFQFEDDHDGHADRDEPTQLDIALSFGGDLAMEAMGTGSAWGDNHKTERRDAYNAIVAKFDPKLPDFSINYDGTDLSWEGRERVGPKPEHKSGHRAEAFEDGDYAPTGKLGRITFVNPEDRSSADHSYVLAIGAYGEGLYLVYADSLSDAFDEMVDWAVDNAPGLLCDDQVNEQFKEIEKAKIAELGRELEDEEKWELWEEAEQDTSTGGNAGNHYLSHEWNLLVEDPDRHDLLDIAMNENPARKNAPPEGPPCPVVACDGHMRKDTTIPGILRCVKCGRSWDITRRGPLPRRNAGVGEGRAGAQSADLTRSILSARRERCDRNCPGWVISHQDRSDGYGIGIETCDECNSIAHTSGGRVVDDGDVAALPEAQRALQREIATGNPAGVEITAKGKRLYKAVEKGYKKVGEARAKEVASRTVISRARQGGRGLVRSSR